MYGSKPPLLDYILNSSENSNTNWEFAMKTDCSTYFSFDISKIKRYQTVTITTNGCFIFVTRPLALLQFMSSVLNGEHCFFSDNL